MRLVRQLLVCGGLLSAAVTVTAASESPVTLGLVPVFPAVELNRRVLPIIEWLQTRCERPIRLTVMSSIPDFERQFLKGQLDLAWLNPYHVVMARNAQGYLPLVRDGKARLQGLLLVRADSPVRQVADLQDQELAFPAPNAFAASLYMRALLERDHQLRFRTRYTQSHSNTYRHVIAGDVIAGGGVNSTLATEPQHIRQQLRVIYETPPTVTHALTAHPRVPASYRDCVQQAMMQAPITPQGRSVMDGILMPEPVVADYQRDYQPLERLKLERYVVLEKAE